MKRLLDYYADPTDTPEWLRCDRRECIACLIAFGLGIVALVALWAVLA